MRLSDIISRLGGRCVGGDTTEIVGVNAAAVAGPNEITFAVGERYFAAAEASQAAAIVVAEPPPASRKPLLCVADVRSYVADLLALLHPEEPDEEGIHPTAVVAPSAQIGVGACLGPHAVVEAGCVLGKGCVVGAGTVVGRNCRLGDGTRLHANVTLYPGVVLGREVVIHAGAVIGADGFSYAPGPGGLKKTRQIGSVLIDDHVEIGANACIDRASFGVTHIQRGVKIDNLVQIGHNCVVGADSALAGQCGLSGSVTLGKGVMLGGQVGVGDHLSVGAGVRVGGQGGIVEDLPSGSRWAWAGYPARPLPELVRETKILRKLVSMYGALQALVEQRKSGAVASDISVQSFRVTAHAEAAEADGVR